MKKLIYILIILFGLVANLCFSQKVSNGFFHSQSINGSLKFKSLYRQQKSIIGDIEENQKSTYYIGGIMLNTTSFLWNPDLILINFDAEYNPESRRETYLLIPDRSEVRTLKKINLRTSVFRNKSISLSSFLNLNQTYFNRELLTNIKSDNRQWGGLLSVQNKILPFSISFRQSDWRQEELQTGRIFSMNQDNLLGRISKSLGRNDKHEFLYSHDDYTYNYAGSKEVNNVIDKFALNNNIYFDRDRKYNYSSLVSYYNQVGDNEFAKIEAVERLVFNLPANIRFSGGYNYHRLEDPLQLLSQNRINGSVNHRLFESLTTNLAIDYSDISHTIYSEENLKSGFDLNYSKKIHFGRINLSYRYFRSNFKMTGTSAPVKIINEEHILSNAIITLLDKPYVDLASILVKDEAGIIIYQLNFDYTITVRNNYVEIQRIIGGQISDKQLVNVDYIAIQPGSYSYEADNNSFSSSLLLFKRLIEIYYRSSVQDYHHLKETEFITLDYFNQTLYGSRIDFGIAGFGMEYDKYNSNIIPYRRFRYFIDLNVSIRSKLLLSLNGNIIDYKIIGEDINQTHSNINGKITYNFSHKTRIDLDAGYLGQRGKNIDLDLITSKLSVSSSFRQLFLKGGLDMYRRHYLRSDFRFTGIFAEVVRKF